MKRNLKALGLTLGALFAMGALSAASASAVEHEFHSTEENTILTGETEHEAPVEAQSILEINGVKVECTRGTYEGTVTGKDPDEDGIFTETEATVHPIYDGPCKIPNVGEASVNTDGCDFVLTSETVETTEGVEHGEVAVECTEGAQITISAPGCTISVGTGGEGSVPEATLDDGVVYTDKETEGRKTVTIDATVKEIPFESEGFLCFFAGIPSKGHNAIYTDEVTVEGFKDGGCTQDKDTHKLTCNEGEPVDIWTQTP